MDLNAHISVDPQVCHGQPCFRGTRVMVYQALELLEAGIAPDEIIRDYYPSLKKESIQAALHYASLLLRDREFVPRS